jgi:hypothetical protein
MNDTAMDHIGALGVGASAAPDAMAAAREAVGAALAGRTPEAGDLMLVFPTIDYDQALFFGAARELAAPAHVVGCSSFSSFTGDAQMKRGAVAAFVPAGQLSFGVAGIDRLGDDIYGAARDVTQLAQDRAGGTAEHAALLMFSDGLAGDQREVVRGSYAVTGATVPLVGGAAGENQRMFTTYQYVDGQLMSNGLVAVWLNSSHPLGVGVQHGWHPIGEPMIVTRAEGNVVYELDGRPAVERYLAQRDAAPLDSNLRGEAAESFSATMVDEPLGLANVSGRFDVRHILGRTPEDGLVMFGHINEQSVVKVMTGDWWDLVDAAERAAADATEQMRTPPRGAIVFSWTGRVAPLGEKVREEAAAVVRSMAGAPIAGFFTYGEFARVTGSTGFHNATVVVLTL